MFNLNTVISKITLSLETRIQLSMALRENRRTFINLWIEARELTAKGFDCGSTASQWARRIEEINDAARELDSLSYTFIDTRDLYKQDPREAFEERGRVSQ